MTASIEGCIGQLQKIAGALSGVRSAPAQPPESASDYPFAVSTLRQSTATPSGGVLRFAPCLFVTQIHLFRADLPTIVAAALKYPEAFCLAIAKDPTLGGNCSTVTALRLRFVTSEWAGIKTIAWDFEIDTKVEVIYG